jgi:hypothetical protein
MNALAKILVALLALFVIAEAHAMRWYSPNTGRWFSRDPIGEEGGENIYAAFNNSPTYNIDLFGLSPCQSDYRWIVHPPMRDRDLQTAQVITVSTTKRVGQNSQTIQAKAPFAGLWGLTITEPSLVGGDCCCSSSGVFKPVFELVVHSQIYLLDKRSSEWGIDRFNSGDPNVDEYWHRSPEWYRRHLVMNHEKKHQAHGKKNYEMWQSQLKAAEQSTFSSQAACLQAVERAIDMTWLNFMANEARDTDALHRGN